jgi:hypothetical protein
VEILQGGYAYTSVGGRFVSATVAGSMGVSSNAVLSTLDIKSGGSVSARRGCSATGITVSSGGILRLDDYTDGGNIRILSSGSAWLLNMGSYSGLSLGNGAVCSASAYIALSSVSVGEGARLFLSAYTSATGVTVESGGSLTVGSGCTAANVTSAEGAVIAVSDGGHVEYAEQGGI